MPRACPRDRDPLHERLAGRINVDVCSTCHGTFLDGIEVQRAVGDARLVFELANMHGHTSEPLACPACSEQMLLDTVDGIRIDHCRTCLGLWLDGGELDRLAGRSLTSFAHARAEKLDLTLRELAIALKTKR